MFTSGARDRSKFHIGLETEKIPVLTKNCQAVPFKGGIESVLNALSADGWEKVFDHNELIALSKDQVAITLEPGGQLELSGAQHKALKDIEQELYNHLKEVKDVACPLGISFLGLGIHPKVSLEQVEWVPKSRYKIMRKFYESKKGLGLHMMSRTASTQVNMDFSSEMDARKKVFAGSALAPIVGAMYANSAVEEGRLNGYASKRLEIWRFTDKERCGTPKFFMDGTFTFEQYRDYAMHVPMYFLYQNKTYVDHTHHTFYEFLNEGKAVKSDWVSHLTTLFPNTRVKGHLEFRTADATAPDLTIALAAFWKGIIYDDEVLGEVNERFKGFTKDDVDEAMKEAALFGLKGQYKQVAMLDLAREVVAMAQKGLKGFGEERYLQPLMDLVEEGLSPGEKMQMRWPVDLCGVCP